VSAHHPRNRGRKGEKIGAWSVSKRARGVNQERPPFRWHGERMVPQPAMALLRAVASGHWRSGPLPPTPSALTSEPHDPRLPVTSGGPHRRSVLMGPAASPRRAPHPRCQVDPPPGSFYTVGDVPVAGATGTGRQIAGGCPAGQGQGHQGLAGPASLPLAAPPR
jgi:hypothetical protein